MEHQEGSNTFLHALRWTGSGLPGTLTNDELLLPHNTSNIAHEEQQFERGSSEAGLPSLRAPSPDSLMGKDHDKVLTRLPPEDTWRWEIFNAVLSTLCVLAIIVILFRVDGRLLSSWTIPLSLNAVIATLSTASKASMILTVAESISQLKWLHYDKSQNVEHLQIFDEASRGPWGSLKFLWSARHVSYVAYLGCIVIITAIALDPFTQQILSYSQHPTIMSGSMSHATRSQVYDNSEKGLTQLSMNMGSSISSSIRDGPLQAAAISGVYSFVSSPPFFCPGSNCTYPSFTSLAICNKCDEVTNQTIQHCTVPDMDKYPQQECNFTTPKGLEVQAWAVGDDQEGFRYTHINSTFSTTDTFCGDEPLDICSQPMYAQFNDWEDYIVLLNNSIIRFDPKYEVVWDWDSGFNTPWQDTLQAYDCMYEICAVEYSNWTTVNGILATTPLRKSSLNATMPVGFERTGGLLIYNTLDHNFPGNQTFLLNEYDLLNMARILQNMTYNSVPGQDQLLLDALFNSADLMSSMDNIALGMSYQILQGPNSTLVFGDVYDQQTYIRVHWAWLSLTLVLIVSANGFLAAVIFANRKTRQPLWKASLIPLLYEEVRFVSGL